MVQLHGQSPVPPVLHSFCCQTFQRRWRPLQESYLKKIMEKPTHSRHDPFPSPTPPKKKSTDLQQHWGFNGWLWLWLPRESTAYCWSTSRNPPTCWRGKSAWKSAWRGEAKRLPSKPEPKKQSCLRSSHLCSIPCSIDLWIASLELYLSYLSKSGGLWENRPNHRVWLTGFWRIEDCQNNVAALCESKKKTL